MQISKTFDYERFKFLKTNRVVRNTNQLKQSILQCDLTYCNPIKVTKNFEIIDGQNRFTVCKELKKPIYYTIIDSDSVDVNEAITILNTAQRTWKLDDYLHKYVAEGRPNYIDFMKFLDYHGVNRAYCGVMSMVFSGSTTDYNKKLKYGLLGEKWDKADDVMRLITSMSSDIKPTRSFIEAFITYYKTHSAKQVEKLRKKIIGVPNFACISDFLTAFDKIVR